MSKNLFYLIGTNGKERAAPLTFNDASDSEAIPDDGTGTATVGNLIDELTKGTLSRVTRVSELFKNATVTPAAHSHREEKWRIGFTTTFTTNGKTISKNSFFTIAGADDSLQVQGSDKMKPTPYAALKALVDTHALHPTYRSGLVTKYAQFVGYNS